MANQESSASRAVPPPVNDGEMESIFRLLTKNNREARFEKMISSRDEAKIINIASFMETNPDYFVRIVTTENGSTRMKKLFIFYSLEANRHFCKAIISRFFQIATDNHARLVTILATMIFDQENKTILLDLIRYYALDLAKHEYGSLVVNRIIDEPHLLEHRNRIMNKVAEHAYELSTQFCGGYVVWNMLNVNDFTGQYVHLALLSLRERCVELSFTDSGSCLVYHLLEGSAKIVNQVVQEIMDCGDNKLVTLAKDEFGYKVVIKALKVTGERVDSIHLFTPLVRRLKTIRPFLGGSTHGNYIGTLLDGTFLPWI